MQVKHNMNVFYADMYVCISLDVSSEYPYNTVIVSNSSLGTFEQYIHYFILCGEGKKTLKRCRIFAKHHCEKNHRTHHHYQRQRRYIVFVIKDLYLPELVVFCCCLQH